MTKKKSVPFTLLEMLIALGIIALLSGVFSISINKALREQRFNSEVQLVVEQIQLAQDLMLILKTDVELHFAKDKEKGGIRYWLYVEKPLSSNYGILVKRPKKSLQAIKAIAFEGQNLGDEMDITLQFLSGGTVMSRGELALNSEEDSSRTPLRRRVFLEGYPRPIKSSAAVEAPREETLTREESERLYPRELLEKRQQVQ